MNNNQKNSVVVSTSLQNFQPSNATVPSTALARAAVVAAACPAALEPVLDTVLKETVGWLMHGNWQFDEATAWDVAADSLEYSLRPAIKGEKPFPEGIDHVRALMRTYAPRRAADHYRRHRRDSQMVFVDEVRVDGEGEHRESRDIERKSQADYEEQRRREDRAEVAGYVYDNYLDQLLDELHLNDMKRGVFIDAYLYHRSPAQVAKKYGITENYCYNIVCNVKKALAREGRAFLRKNCPECEYALAS